MTCGRKVIKDVESLGVHSGAEVARQTLFDPALHYLGTKCKRGHDFAGSGFSVRYRSMEGCVACLVESGAAARKKAAAQKLSLLEAIPSGSKRCSRCKEIKSVDEFHNHRSEKSGVSGYCRPCTSDIGKEYRLRHKERCKERGLIARKKRNWAENLFRGSKSSAKARGLEHCITQDDITEQWKRQGGLCYWLGIKLGDESLANRHPLKPSLDRLDPGKGYVLGNIVLATTFANLGRSNTPPDIFAEFISIHLRPTLTKAAA